MDIRSQFFSVCYGPRRSRVLLTRKKERGQYPAILPSRLINKGLVVWDQKQILLRDMAHPSRTGMIASSCPLSELAI